ncbi:MAG: hypothetical protein QGH60_15495 [Phycisphaerae bacterium]|nr:hypothetical protein [Phycisphaerae bacterium]
MHLLTRKSMVLVVLGGLLAGIGCGEDNRMGVVIETKKRQGFLHSGFESEVTIRRPDGSTTKLGHVGNPFFVITFIEVPADKLGFVDPRIERLAKRFELDSVAVIQISMPEGKTTFSDEAIAEADLQPIYLDNLSRFLDPERRAWKIFGEPDCEAVLVVDRRGLFGNMHARGTLDDLDRVIRRVQRLQTDWEIEQREFKLDY